MLISRAKLRVLCYNNLRAIVRPQRQQDLGTFLTNYKQLNHTYTFKIIFKYVICIKLYTIREINHLLSFALSLVVYPSKV